MTSEERSCGIVLYREDGGARLYLLLHYDKGHWDFPKGHIEHGETDEETARRETREETGITKIELHPNFREAMAYRLQKRDGRRVKKTVSFFVGKTDELEVKVSHEHQGYSWLPFSEAVKKLTYENAKNMIRKADAHLSSL